MSSGQARGQGSSAAHRVPPPLPSRFPTDQPHAELYSVNWDFDGQSSEELTVRANDNVVVNDKSDAEWWGVTNTSSNVSGFVPRTYLSPLAKPPKNPTAIATSRTATTMPTSTSFMRTATLPASTSFTKSPA